MFLTEFWYLINGLFMLEEVDKVKNKDKDIEGKKKKIDDFNATDHQTIENKL